MDESLLFFAQIEPVFRQRNFLSEETLLVLCGSLKTTSLIELYKSNYKKDSLIAKTLFKVLLIKYVTNSLAEIGEQFVFYDIASDVRAFLVKNTRFFSFLVVNSRYFSNAAILLRHLAKDVNFCEKIEKCKQLDSIYKKQFQTLVKGTNSDNKIR